MLFMERRYISVEVLGRLCDAVQELISSKDDTVMCLEDFSDAVSYKIEKIMQMRRQFLGNTTISCKGYRRCLSDSVKELQFIPIESQLVTLTLRRGYNRHVRCEMIVGTIRRLLLYEKFNGIYIKDLRKLLCDVYGNA